MNGPVYIAENEFLLKTNFFRTGAKNVEHFKSHIIT